ncbi:putative zinc-binding metallopeptidase [Ferruginibacter lapsinanis]|uniref:substrate import-associated zinc metallohydrolase lipoprotein n=1 Tax=Ferruginibacter lapsinanis TaxID=563172 RepID=UPI001E2AA898|nr:substrate import-associated zinc metallohydrolase lipoprotein [Ferruginibacter lapsinanis]UEG48506.1 putative zinc-binding metallopeptidase [Ferruginibacter lapsinanis]
MKILKIAVYSVALVLFFSSCRKDDAIGNVDNIPGLGGDVWTPSAIDKWIYDSLVVPYNIDVKYKWNQFSVNQIEKNVVPPNESQVVPVMDAVRRIWAKPYIQETSLTFFNKYTPKYFVLAGSSAANPDGSATVGVAGGGRQISLFQLNYYKNKTYPGYVPADTTLQKDLFLTVHHEFSHIFDQTKRRPSSFDAVTSGGYSSDWINTDDVEARKNGFITAYASSAAGEDFAEMISFLLVYGDPGWKKLLAGISGTGSSGLTAANARIKLNTKADEIRKYFADSWGIDFNSLQTRVRAAVANEFY